MNLHLIPNLHRVPARRGVSAILLVMSLVVLIGVLGLALEVGLVRHVMIQLQGACDAAALAGVVELMDEDILRPGRYPDPADDIAAARQAALSYAQANVAASCPVLLHPNEHNDPAGDLVVGLLEDPTDRDCPLLLWQGAGPCNTLGVKAERSGQRGNPVPLWLGQLLGVAHADLSASACASIDQRVYGFRPLCRSAVPLVPLAALCDDTPDSWTSQAFAFAVPGENDNFVVDYVRGHVSSGSDGIPEIQLRSRPESGNRPSRGVDQERWNLSGLILGPTQWNVEEARRQLREGISHDDLAGLGGQLALHEDGRLLVPGIDQLRGELVHTLRDIKGENRIWPLYRAHVEPSDPLIFELVGFSAGRLANVTRGEDGELVVTVQASLLHTRMALVRALKPGEQANPWIARLCLTR